MSAHISFTCPLLKAHDMLFDPLTHAFLSCASAAQPKITRSRDEAVEIIRKHIDTLGPNPTAESFSQLASVHR